jgi:copper(I)-binding protein
MVDRSMSRPSSRRRFAAAVVSAGLLVGACGQADEDAPLEVAGPEVKGGAVGPDVQVSEDIGLRQVQLEYPLDRVYEGGEDARLFFAITNTGSEPATLTDISGPDFSGIRVVTDEGTGMPLQIDANDNLYVGAEGPPDVTLLDLGRSLRSSQSIPVTFTFADAGEVTLDVPVSAEGQTPSPPFDFPSDAPDQDPTEDDPSAPGGEPAPTG